MIDEHTLENSYTCALTGKIGSHIRCHIIPQALTEGRWRNQPLTQRGRHGNNIRRWTSWYDPALVTQAGEDILQSYDDWAIDFFRRKKLIWSSWGPMLTLSTSYMEFYSEHSGFGLRKIVDVNTKRLRIFYLSLLWRAAACNLWEFDQIKVPNSDLLQLRQMVLEGNPEPWNFYPLSLIQLCTQTIPFNQTFSRLTKYEPTLDAQGNPGFEKTKPIGFFRIYFDGLIANLNIFEDPQHFAGAETTFVTSNPEVQVLVLPSERSLHVSRINFNRGIPVPSEHLPKLVELEQSLTHPSSAPR